MGYLGGAAVAAGVGAAIAVAGQGTAYADTDTSPATSSESSKQDKADKADKTEKDTKDTVAAVSNDDAPKKPSKPTFDPAKAVQELTKQFGLGKPTKAQTKDDADDEATEESEDVDEVVEDVDEPEPPAETEPEPEPEPEPEEAATTPVVFDPLGDLADKANEVVAALSKPSISTAATAQTTADTDADEEPGPVPWSINPFRPMPPEPAPNDMPGPLWTIEQQLIQAFSGVPFLQPFVREGYEAAFRGSQFIPFVNAVIPAINIINQFPNLASGDPVVFKTATQNIINNLIVTLHPVSVLYYGYDEIADFINLEYEAQELKELFYATTWDILDPFALLHNRGQSGLPLSPSSPGQITTPPQETTTVKLAAAVSSQADAPGSDPFRTDDPDPIGMPAILIQTRNLVMLVLPTPAREVFREGFELAYRASQIVPGVNVVLPVTEIVPALIQALLGNKTGAQIAINQLLLATGPVSMLYYGYDQIADLLNTEDEAFAAKQQFYADTWDTIDPYFILHNQGQSGLIGS
ncbi:hypothetical protein BVC93_15855 [Mycobacterium sp. MS1601]|nr:hypothetical protein BVC93_15855 [Mycobacterium sp. MS1601]